MPGRTATPAKASGQIDDWNFGALDDTRSHRSKSEASVGRRLDGSALALV
jgi:hypothetical protein